MSLVQVHCRKIDSQFVEHFSPTNPKDYLLDEALFLVTGIETGCNPAGPGIV